MPKSKTIEIDEILPPGDDTPPSATKPNTTTSPGWKTRLTILLGQWFIFLRRKSYGKWILIPAITLAILLTIPLGIITLLWLIIKPFIKSLTNNTNPTSHS